MKFFEAIGGRKFAVLLIATGLLLFGKVDMEVWKWIVGFYMGANLGQKIGVKKK